MEAEVGRKIESETNRERVRWEAVYGNKIGILESEDSVTKPSAGVTVREIDNSTSESFEMSNLSKEVRSRQDSSRSSAEAKPVIIPVGNDDDITEIDFSGNPVARDISRGNSLATGKSDSPKPSTEAGSGGYISERASPRASAPPPPPMFSPPFNIPYGETDTFKEAAPSTTAGLLNGGSLRRKGSQRRSSDFVRRTLSSRSRRERNSASQEELGMPLVAHEDDQASSVAATYDVLDEDELSLSDRSLPHGESDWEEDERPVDTMPTVSEIDSINHDKSERATTLAADEESKSEGEEEPEETASPSSEQKTATTLKGRRASRRASGMTAPDSEGGPSRPRSRAPSRPQSLHSIAQESFTGSLSEHLPEKLSKIALSYRTNEWAKYLETAEKPEEEELQEPESPGVSVEPVFAETVKKESKAKNVAGYQAPPPGAVTVRGNSVIVVPQTQTQRHQIAPQGSQTFSSTPVSLSRQSSSTHVDGASNIINMGGSLSRQSSATKIATRNPMRSSSGPLAGTPLGETPIEEESDPNRAFQQLNSPTPETLLGQRDSMMKNRVSTMGFNRITSNPNVNVIPASDAGGSRSGTQKGQHAESTPLTAEHLQGLEEESEDMTLAQRRQLIQARRASSSGNSGYSPPTSTRQRSYSQQYAASPQQQWGAPVATFDSHQPNRGVHSSMDDSRRENNLAKWRASLRENIDGPSTGAQRPTADEGRRAKMLNERRQTEAWKTMQERQAHARDAAFDSMMRRGDMQDLHREAIRKMQGVANKNAE